MTPYDQSAPRCPSCGRYLDAHCANLNCRWRYCPHCQLIVSPSGATTWGSQHPRFPPTAR